MQYYRSRFAHCFPPRQSTETIIREWHAKARQRRTSGRRTVQTVCAAYRHSPLYGIDQGHPQLHFQSMAVRRKRRKSREITLSSRQSRLTDVGEINRKSSAIFLSWTALSRDKLSIAALARHGRLYRSQGTSNSIIKRIPSTRTTGFDDSIRCTGVAT